MSPRPTRPRITVVRAGEHDAALADVLHAAAGARHLVVDLGGVRTLDPADLAALVRARQQVRQDTGGWVCLASPSRFVLTVLHVMRLEPAFPVFADCRAALAWLDDGAAGDLPSPWWAAATAH
jgi:anti-anti-sigma factor